jgi:hypothetical protein
MLTIFILFQIRCRCVPMKLTRCRPLWPRLCRLHSGIASCDPVEDLGVCSPSFFVRFGGYRTQIYRFCSSALRQHVVWYMFVNWMLNRCRPSPAEWILIPSPTAPIPRLWESSDYLCLSTVRSEGRTCVAFRFQRNLGNHKLICCRVTVVISLNSIDRCSLQWRRTVFSMR